MTTKKATIIWILSVAIIAVVALVYGGRESIIEENVGAVSSPDLMNPYVSFNGVMRLFEHQKFNQATITPCVFESPKATSTLISLNAQMFEATATALTLGVFKTGVETYATTSGEQIGSNYVWSDSVTGNTKDADGWFFYASTSPDSQKIIFTPRQNVVIAWSDAATIENSAEALESLDGYCNVEWETLEK